MAMQVYYWHVSCPKKKNQATLMSFFLVVFACGGNPWCISESLWLHLSQVKPEAGWPAPPRGAIWDGEGAWQGRGGSFALVRGFECGPSVPPAGMPEMVWHFNHSILTDLNTNGCRLIVSWFIRQTSSPLPPAQLLQSKPLSLNRPDYYFPSKVLICVSST